MDLRDTDTRPRVSVVLLAALAVVLIVAPLPLGANRVWAWSVLEIFVFALLFAWWVLSPLRRAPAPFELHDPVILGAGAWILYLCLYLVPLPSSVVQLLSPGVHASYAEIYRISGTPPAFLFLTLDRYLSIQVLVKQLMYVMSFILVVGLLINRGRVKFMLYVVVIAGVVQVGIGVTAGVTQVDLVPAHLLDGHWDILRGTFVNRNHFAAFLALTASAGVGLMLCHFKHRRRDSNFRLRISMLIEEFSGPVLISVAGLAVIGAGMIMSSSRGGVGAFVMALSTVLALSLLARGWKSRESLLVWPLAAAIALGFIWEGSRDLIERVVSSGLVADERWVQWRESGEMITDYWLTGVGPGLYEKGFAAYKSTDLRPLVYDHAHNDYLELFAEGGLIGILLLGAFVAIIFSRVLRALFRRKDIVVRGALFASLTGMLSMLIHGLVEFNFQIPANALYFWVLAGVGVAATRLPRSSSPRVDVSSP